MTDQVLLDSYLLLLKSTVEVYVHGTLESSNEKVHNLLKKCLDNTLSMQYDTYNEMADCGWYNIKNVSDDIIEKTINKLNNN